MVFDTFFCAIVIPFGFYSIKDKAIKQNEFNPFRVKCEKKAWISRRVNCEKKEWISHRIKVHGRLLLAFQRLFVDKFILVIYDVASVIQSNSCNIWCKRQPISFFQWLPYHVQLQHFDLSSGCVGNLFVYLQHHAALNSSKDRVVFLKAENRLLE